MNSKRIKKCKNCKNNILNGCPFVIKKNISFLKCYACNKYIDDIHYHSQRCINNNVKKHLDTIYFCTKDCHISYLLYLIDSEYQIY